jgi:hypothetical protein
MSDQNDQNGGGFGEPPREEERPLRWAPGQLSEQQRLSAAAQPPGTGPEPPESPPLPPPEPKPSWERLEEVGFFGALFRSIREVLFEPGETFARMPREPALGRALLFAVLLGTIGAYADAGYGFLLNLVLPNLGIPGAMSDQASFNELFKHLGFQQPQIDPALRRFLEISMIAIAPIRIIIWAFIWAGIIHLLLMLFNGANQGYETTFRTLCYVKGATSVFGLIPLCGLFPIAFVWAIVCAIVGLASSQQTSGGKAAGAVLTPYLLCCLCLGMVGVGLLLRYLQAVGSGPISF